MRVELVSVPYRYDQRGEGVGGGPDALLAQGLVTQLGEAGVIIGEQVSAELDPSQHVAGRTAVNIGHLGADTARLVAAARANGGGALVLAGDDTACVGVVAGLQAAYGVGTRIGIVWFDAHGDFNTPETSYSGILAGMPLAILAGLAGPLWREAAGLVAPVPTDRILIAGTRDLDEKEKDLLHSTEVRVVDAAQLREGRALAEPVERLARRCDLLYLHLDLDVLDPRFVPSASTPSANGLTIDELSAATKQVLQTGKVAAMSLSSLNPGGGARGQRSIASALSLLQRTVPSWTSAPA